MKPWILAAMAGVLGWMAGCGGASRTPEPEPPPETNARAPAESPPPPASEPAPPSGSGSTVCEGLLPARVAPRSVDIQTGIYEVCASTVAMDGTGTLAYAWGDGAFSRYHWRLVDPDGTRRLARLDSRAPDPVLWPQATGFQVVNPSCRPTSSGVDFYVLEGTGQLSAVRSIGGAFNFDCHWDEYDSAPDPTGGTVVAWYLQPRATLEGEPRDPSYQMRLQRFDATGQPRFAEVSVARWPPARGEPTALVVGTDTRGRTLVLWKGDPLFGAGTTAGRWFEADGTALTPVFEADVPAFLPKGQTQVLTPLYGGGLVLQVDGVWTHGFASGDPRASAPPDWLARRQGRLERVRGGKAYALLPSVPSAPVSEQQVEVLAPDGTSCGHLPFASEKPTREPLVLGAEGGIVQNQPLAHPTNDEVQGCTLTRWPEVLR